jgi:hypothetical protein
MRTSLVSANEASTRPEVSYTPGEAWTRRATVILIGAWLGVSAAGCFDSKCKSNADCASGSTCDTSTGRCVAALTLPTEGPTPSAEAHTPPAASASATAEQKPPVPPNPWAAYGKGSRFETTSTIVSSTVRITSRRTETIKEKTDAKVVLAGYTTSTMTVSGVTQPARTAAVPDEVIQLNGDGADATPERVTVPAGEFSCLKTKTVTNGVSSESWIDKDDHFLVKSITTVNGKTTRTELRKVEDVTLQAAGSSFACKHVTLSTDDAGKPSTTEFWVSKDYPNNPVRMVSSAPDPTRPGQLTTTTLEVSKIDRK